ncbi:hypothetical protein FZC83_02125 [Rossellomorea marisflavi]|uniref:Thoeris protein ThsB TIR-like domain-containing protein n=1 Tax=Rossellomorea marisflavi TaxID=189381 RepID=A0A5D4RYC6_9BACI|nr:TIR domain-containing protein [Rossellomorea marisflavi]TYS56393.1 hypothetical protein FZC83_02125 [Rossellomorea marisflavi]
MTYRNGTYVAFNGMGTTNPTESDRKYYALLQKWGNEKSIDFKFNDSHKKTYSVYDTSSNETLKARLRERMRSSKNFLLVLSQNPQERGMLGWEIKEAVNTYKLPFIVCYTGPYERLNDPFAKKHFWTQALTECIATKELKAIHIPFKKSVIGDAISQFSIHKNNLNTPFHTYSASAYEVFEERDRKDIWSFLD